MKTLRFIMVAVLITAGHHLTAQERFAVEYFGELQSDFRGGFNFPNLLRLQTSIPIGSAFSVEAASISVARTAENRLIDDLQTFSNIEEENLPFALAKAGVNIQVADEHSIFLGVRNVNEDYFTSPVTSLFTGSSCGIFPTISCNYPIANYPLSSLAMHYCWESENWQTQASLYNGSGYNGIWGQDSVLHLRRGSDGLFAIGQCGFTEGGSCYYLGGCVYSCVSGVQSSGVVPSSSGGTVWLYAEKAVWGGLSVIADYSHAFGSSILCRDFMGIGCHYALGGAEFGLFSDYARFADNYECATELTCKVRVSEHVDIQPAIHLINQSNMNASVALLRFCVSL